MTFLGQEAKEIHLVEVLVYCMDGLKSQKGEDQPKPRRGDKKDGFHCITRTGTTEGFSKLEG